MLGIRYDKNCKVTPGLTGHGVHVLCDLMDNDPATTCVAVVHKKISHLDSNGLTAIDSYILKRSHQSNRVSLFIPGLNLNESQIGFIEFTSTLPDGN